MPRKALELSEKIKRENADRKIRHKLNSLKTDFDSGKVKNFEQVFAIIGPSVWAKLMHMGYDTFMNKSKNPGSFTNNELIYFAELVDVDVNIVIKFIFSAMKFKNKYKEGITIRV
ncbi:hypothetical protein LQ567_16535 [Niabella pedocola]|uniref:Uncharacterized protein n=1 Tax=Niabella pedocola TaxID=1752077 RepID=A0ABS8PTI3_9BACT|nr:hypothetical protein [Niabella pedocola]MCD2424389.1 hypothetical protein [Niabella pedocola]